MRFGSAKTFLRFYYQTQTDQPSLKILQQVGCLLYLLTSLCVSQEYVRLWSFIALDLNPVSAVGSYIT